MRRIFILFLLILTNKLEAQQPKLMLPIGHTNNIYSASFSPDGKKIITASADNTAKIWELPSGFLLADLRDHKDFILSANFSRDGKYIVTASFDSTAIIWNAATGESLRRLRFPSGRLSFADFSPDGKYVAAVGEDFTRKNKEGTSMVYGNETIRIWETATGEIVHRFDSVWGHVESLAFTQDSRRLLTVFSIQEDFGKVNYNRIVVWDMDKGKIVAEPKGDVAGLSPDGKLLLTLSGNGEWNLREAFDGKLIYRGVETSEPFSHVKFSPDGKYFCLFSGKAIQIRQTATGEIFHEIINEQGEIKDVCFSPGGKYFVCSYYNRTLIRDLASARITDSLEEASIFKNFCSFSPDGKWIAVPSFENKIRVFDAKTRSVFTELKGHSATGISVAFSPSGPDDSTGGKYLLTVLQEPPLVDYSIPVWDMRKGTPLYRIQCPWKEIVYARFNPGGRSFITASENDSADIWEAASGKLLQKVNGNFRYGFSLDFSPDNRQYVVTDLAGDAKLFKTANPKPAYIFRQKRDKIQYAIFSPDGKRIVTASGSDSILVWDAFTRKILYRIAGHTIPPEDIRAGISTSIFSRELEPVRFSDDGKWLVTVSAFGPVKIWNAENGKFIKELKKDDNAYYSARFSPDAKYLVTTSFSPDALIWDSRTGELLHTLKGHHANINAAVFSPDGKKIITVSMDNTARVWNASTGEQLFSFFTVDSSGYFVQVPSAFYMGSRDAAQLLHYVTKDLKVITFEQLDVKYNRPDIILEAIGSTDTALIKSYRKAWEKRIKKLGIDTTAFRDGYSVPEADFANRTNIEYEQGDGKLRLIITGADSTYKLDRFNVWVNETPLYGQRGISIRNKNVNNFDSSINIDLSLGENRIETSITNVNGTESYRMPLMVNYTAQIKQREKTYFIGIGIDQFADNRYNLKYSTKDIRDLSKKLKEKYKDIIIDTLFNENVTVSNVKALKQKLLQTSVNDKVIISYSGHGMLSKDFDYYLSTYAVNFDKPEENGLPYDELESLLDSIPARKKLMLIDACHSGEVDKDDLMAINNLDTSKIKKGLQPVAYKSGHLGLKNSFELMKSLFVNVGKSTGATIISAAAGTQFALEGIDNLPNGVFTYCILEAMNKYPSMKISELKKIVGERVEEITKGLQKPTSRNETIAVDWEIWSVK